MDEGYIKFQINHQFKSITIPDNIYIDFTKWRTRLLDLGYIGETSEGIGFGNISIRYKQGFFITGSATGKKRVLEESGYAFVHAYNIQQNKVSSKGETKASSESMSHAAIYECHTEIMAIIHIHNLPLWKSLLHKKPTTAPGIAYGTPEMAKAIQQVLHHTAYIKENIIVMGGHEEGIITFGKSLDEAGHTLLNLNVL